MPSLKLASVIDVESLNTSSLNALKKKQVNMADYEDDEKEGFEIKELNDSDFLPMSMENL